MAIYNGTSVRNVWNGTISADTAYGNGGDDSLYGKGGNDILYGDVGNDGLYGDDGNDTLYGGDGVDALSGGNGADTLRGENGDDYILGGIGDDGLYGDAGIDRLRGEDGVDALFGGAGTDDLQGGNGNDYLDGGTENDTLIGGAGDDRLRGGDGNDRLDGSAGDDNLAGGNGNDTLFGFGNDQLLGDAGNDILTWYERGESRASNLLIDGGAGIDRLHIDTQALTRESPDDVWVGESIATVALGSSGTGGLWYTLGRQEILNTEAQGTFKNVESITVAPETRLDYFGGTGSSTITGGNRDDLFYLGSGNETITTGASNGGYGGDIIRISMFNPPFGKDIITDFDPGRDFFVITGADWDHEDEFVWEQAEANGNTVLTIDDTAGNELVNLTLLGVTGLASIKDTHEQFWG